MSRLVSRAESWEQVYSAFSNINFAAFDYNTVKQSILDYIKLSFPETFNDFIESSELIAIVESFAYIAELLAYRMDVTAHENFISTAQRRDSILKLAKLISYKASRPLPARGLVKITSVSTTETLIDSNGTNLSGRSIRWNDTTNSAWKDQFILVMNRVLEQNFGTVTASDRFQMQDVLFEIYPLITTQGVMPFSANVYGHSINMELVPVAQSIGDAFSGTVSGITERRPQQNSKFTILYGSDGLGDASETTGFLCYTKQGSLTRHRSTFDAITPNQIFAVPTLNVNDTDVWVNNVDPITGDIVNTISTLPYSRATTAGLYGEWVEVDISHSQNVIFNTNPKRNKYEVETVANNQVRILFGDGEFADIPAGTFDIWVRSSLDDDVVIPQSSIVDAPMSIAYTDAYNQSQTFTFTVSLIGSLQNASAAESTEHVRQTAPAVYYTQDRMVNGQDYNTYLRQNPTILKLRAVNRTFAGDSKYITWHDSSNTYENVKMFGDDGLFYYTDTNVTVTTPITSVNTLISTYIEPLLASTDIFMQLVTAGVPYTSIHRILSYAEKNSISTALIPPPAQSSADMYYNTFDNNWYAVKTADVASIILTFGGYQTIELNGYASVLDKPLAYVPATSYELHLTGTSIIGSFNYGIVVTTPPATFGDLINLINTKLESVTHGITAALVNGNILLSIPANVDPAKSIVYVDQAQSFTLLSDIIISTTATPSIHAQVLGYVYPTNFIAAPLISIRQISQFESSFYVTRLARRMIFESHTTSFWNTNNANTVVDYDTLRSSYDTINILQANVNANRTGVLKRNWNYNVMSQEVVDSGPDAGIADIHRISVMATDENSDRVPDNLNVENYTTYAGVADFIKPKIKMTVSGEYTDVTLPAPHIDVTLPVPYIVGFGDIEVITPPGTLLEAPVFNTASGSLTTAFGNQTSPTGFGWIETDSLGAPAVYGQISTTIRVTMPPNGTNTDIVIKINEHVYFNRVSPNDLWNPVQNNAENMMKFVNDFTSQHYKTVTVGSVDTVEQYNNIDQVYEFNKTWRRNLGRDNLNFNWMHFSPRYHLVDPSPTNIVDIFVITRGYYISFKRWLEDPLAVQPDMVTPLSLRNDYGKLLDNKMVSDTVILHPGNIKLIFGSKSAPALQARFKVIRSVGGILTDNQVKNVLVATVRNFFDIATFEFGETFFFTELATAIHMDLATEISSVVLVPTLQNSQFGNMLQIFAREDEVIYPDVSVADIDIVTGYTPTNLRLNG
jgi:hypothetical protein